MLSTTRAIRGLLLRLLLPTAALLLAPGAALAQVPQVQVDVAGGSGPTEVCVDVSLRSQPGSEPSALGFQLRVPAPYVFTDVTIGPAAESAGKTLADSGGPTNVRTVLVAGLDATPVQDGVVVTACVDVTSAPPEGTSFAIEVASVTASSPSGNALTTGGSSAGIAVDPTALADVDGDGDVDAVDIQRAVNAFVFAFPPLPRADLDGDGAVGVQDVQLVVNVALGLPVVRSISPARILGGGSVTIVGANFGDDPALVVVDFGGLAGTVTSVTPTEIVVTVPPAVQAAGVTVSLIFQTTASNTVAYTISGPAIATPQLAFGAVPIGTPADLTFELSNTATVDITGTVDATPPFTIEGATTYALAPAQTATFTVRFTPVAVAPASAFVTCSGPEGTVTLAVSGSGRVVTDPSLLFFGPVTVNMSADLPVVIDNPGTVALSGTASTSAPFSIVGSATVDVPPGQSQTLMIRFAPTAVGPAQGTLAILGSPVPLAGTGSTAPVVPGWRPANAGLFGGEVRALDSAATNPSILYAGTGGAGVYKTTDGGATFTAVNTGFEFDGLPVVEHVAVDPRDASVVYASLAALGTRPTLYRTTDGGASWSLVDTGFPADVVYQPVFDPVTAGTIYLAGDGLLRSTDGGTMWQQVIALSGPTTVAIDPTNASILYLGASDGLRKSTDGGATFTLLVSAAVPLPGVMAVRHIAIDPSTPSTVAIGGGVMFQGNAGNAVRLSVDGGGSWQNVLLPDLVAGIAFDPAASALYVAAPQFCRLTNGGTTVDVFPYDTPPRRPTPRALELAGASALYTGTSYGVYRTTDAGSTWTEGSSGIAAQHVVSLAVAPSAPGTIYAVTRFMGVFRSTDGAATWSPASEGLPSLSFGASLRTGFPAAQTPIAVHPTSPQIVYLGVQGQGVYKTVDGGATWAPANGGMDDQGIATIAIDPLNPQTVYAGAVPTAFASRLGIFKTTNGGTSWEPRNSSNTPSLLDSAIHGIAFSPVDRTTLFAIAVTQAGRFVIRSTNAADSWQGVFGPPDLVLQGSAGSQRLTLSGASGFTIYAFDDDRFIHASTDGGTMWSERTRLPTALITGCIVADPTAPGRLYLVPAGDQAGFTFSGDGGMTFSDSNLGLVNRRMASSSQVLALDPATPTTMVLGTIGGGVFTNTNGGE